MKAEKQKLTKIYYSMGEVAEMFDVNTTLIRFWESKFDVLKPHRNKNRHRLFTPEDVETLKLIYHLVKEKGMTLAGAQKRIKDNREGVERNMEIIEKLQNIKAVLLEIKQEMKGGDAEDTILVDDDGYEGGVSDPAVDVEADTNVSAGPAVDHRPVGMNAAEVSDMQEKKEPTAEIPGTADATAGSDDVQAVASAGVMLDEEEYAVTEGAFHIDASPEPAVDMQFGEMNARVTAHEEKPECMPCDISAVSAVEGTVADEAPADVAGGLPAALSEEENNAGSMLDGGGDELTTEVVETNNGGQVEKSTAEEDGGIEIEVQRPKVIEQTLF